METKVKGGADLDPYQAESDANTLMRANEIKSNPKRHGAAHAHAKTKLAAMQGVIDAEDDPKKGGDGGRDEATEGKPARKK